MAYREERIGNRFLYEAEVRGPAALRNTRPLALALSLARTSAQVRRAPAVNARTGALRLCTCARGLGAA